MYFGFGGLLLGYSLLVLAPGNMQRLLAEHGKDWTIVQALPDNIRMLAIVLFFQLLLWFFVLRTLYSLKKMTIKRRIIKKDILIVKVLCASAFGMSAIMLLSPFFPPRRGRFPDGRHRRRIEGKGPIPSHRGSSSSRGSRDRRPWRLLVFGLCSSHTMP